MHDPLYDRLEADKATRTWENSTAEEILQDIRNFGKAPVLAAGEAADKAADQFDVYAKAMAETRNRPDDVKLQPMNRRERRATERWNKKHGVSS